MQASALEREFISAPLERAREIRNELARGFHRLRARRWSRPAPRWCKRPSACSVWRRTTAKNLKDGELGTGIQRIASLLGFSLSDPGESLGSRGGQSHELVRETVEIVAEPALWATVIQEAGELIDAIDKTVLDLETTDQPRQAIASLFRNYHTLKGAVNTAGLSPTGRELHLVEDFLEALRDRPILPSMRGVTSFLLEVQADMRRQLRQSTQGYVELSLSRVEAAIARLLSGTNARGDAASHSGSQAQSGDTGSVRIAASGSNRDAQRRRRSQDDPRGHRAPGRPDEPGRRAGGQPLAPAEPGRGAARAAAGARALEPAAGRSRRALPRGARVFAGRLGRGAPRAVAPAIAVPARAGHDASGRALVWRSASWSSTATRTSTSSRAAWPRSPTT